MTTGNYRRQWERVRDLGGRIIVKEKGTQISDEFERDIGARGKFGKCEEVGEGETEEQLTDGKIYSLCGWLQMSS